MSARSWSLALVLALVVTKSHAQTVTFPPLVRGEGNGVQVMVPECVLTESAMNCTFMVLNVMSFGSEGNCNIHLHAQRIMFRREDANTWVGDYPVAFCRINNRFRFVQSDGPPKRIALRLTYEYRDRSEQCVQAERDMREEESKGYTLDMEWTDGGADKLIPLKITGCKTFTTSPGQFPTRAFSR